MGRCNVNTFYYYYYLSQRQTDKQISRRHKSYQKTRRRKRRRRKRRRRKMKRRRRKRRRRRRKENNNKKMFCLLTAYTYSPAFDFLMLCLLTFCTRFFVNGYPPIRLNGHRCQHALALLLLYTRAIPTQNMFRFVDVWYVVFVKCLLC